MIVYGINKEDFELAKVREHYAAGRLSEAKLERALEHVLRGGYLNSDLELRSPLLDRVRARRRCANEGHILIDVTGFGATGVNICSRCDYREP